MRGGTGSSAAAATIAAVARGSRRLAAFGSRAKSPLLNCGGFRLTRHRGASSHPAPRLNGVGDESNPPTIHVGGSPGSKNMNGGGSPLGALSTMMAGGTSPLLAHFPGISGGSPGNLYASLLSSPGSMRKNTVLRSTPGTGGGMNGAGAMAPPKSAKASEKVHAADLPQIAEDSPSISGLGGWFDTPGGKNARGSKISPPANAPVPRMAGISAELAGLQSPPHLKGGAAAIPGRLSSIFRRAASGADISSQGGVGVKATKEPAASRRADDVLEVMRQLEQQQNAGDYAQAEQFLAAQERKTRAGAAAAAAAAAAMGVRVEGGDGLSPSQFLEMR